MPERSPWRILGRSPNWALRQICGFASEPCSARWRTDHWLVESEASARADPRRQWVVLPDGRSEAVTWPQTEDSVLERMQAEAAGVQLTIRPVAFLGLAAGAGTGALMHAIWLDPAPWAWEDPTVHDLVTVVLGSLAVANWAAAWFWGLAVTGLVLLSIVIHELGHAFAAVRVGHNWASFNLGIHGAAVRCYPAPTGRNRIIRSAAGPAAQLTMCLPLVATLLLEPTGDVWRQPNPDLLHSIWWVSGLIGALLAVTNLLPIKQLGTDGAKIVEGIQTVAESRRSRQEDS